MQTHMHMHNINAQPYTFTHWHSHALHSKHTHAHTREIQAHTFTHTPPYSYIPSPVYVITLKESACTCVSPQCAHMLKEYRNLLTLDAWKCLQLFMFFTHSIPATTPKNDIYHMQYLKVLWALPLQVQVNGVELEGCRHVIEQGPNEARGRGL